MKIIDAHLHMKKAEGFDALCRDSGHKNEFPHLMSCFKQEQIVGCVVMGTGLLEGNPCRPGLFDLGGLADVKAYQYPSSVGFCIGVDPEGLRKENLEMTLTSYREAIACPSCVGFKIYLGYRPFYADDRLYHPVYELAAEHDLTVAFHTGDTANPTGRLKFSHPLTVDEVAVRYPDLRLVLCHFGNPWMLDAAEVAKKNPNVYVELSGLAVGIPDAAAFRHRYKSYVEQLETWLCYLDRWDHVLYGSDWPLVNLHAYIALIKSFVPQGEWERVFYQNALSAYPRLRNLL